MKHGKKIIIILISALLIALLIIILSSIFDKKEKNYLTDINYSKLEKKINSKDNFVLLIKKDDCYYCELFLPKFKEVLSEYKINAYSIRTNKLSEDEYKKLTSLVTNFNGTPTTVFYKGGKEMAAWMRINGNKDKDIIISRFKSAGYIK